MCGGGAVGGAPGPHLPKGVRPNKSARSRNTAVTTAADAKTRPQSPALEAPAADAAARGRAAAACPGPRRGTHEWHFNWNHFHRKAAAGATLETGMRATAEGTYYVPSVKPRRFCCFHRGQRHSL